MAEFKIPNLENFDIGCRSMKNTYVFKYYDDNNELIDTKIYHNVCMPKRYFVNDVTDLSLRLGVVTPEDENKYKNAKGEWDKNWCARPVGDNGYETPKENNTEPLTKANGWRFKPPEPKMTDTSLWGTTVYDIRLNWSCENMSDSSVEFLGTNVVGFHSPSSRFNKTVGVKGDTLLADGGTATLTISSVNAQGEEKIIETREYEVKPKERVYGINFTDGGLFGVSRNAMISHFGMGGIREDGIVKRPVDHMEVSVTVLFENLRPLPFNRFVSEGNLLYGNSNFPTSGLSRLKPTVYGFSAYTPVTAHGSSVGGCFPISVLAVKFSTSGKLTTDKPKSWDDEKEGPWYGFPHYHYFGRFEDDQPYKTYKVKVKKIINGEMQEVEEERYSLNKEEQKIIDWSKFKNRGIMTYYNSGFYCPIRSFVMEGYGATSAGLPPTGSVNYFQIGVGDGHTTVFYHSITPEIGTISEGYSSLGTERTTAHLITYFSESSNFFGASGFEGIYDDNMNLICSAASANLIMVGGYDKEKKWLHMGYQPFSKQYFSHPRFNNTLIGSGEWLVYKKGGTIRSAWVGMNTAYDFFPPVTIKTARNVAELRTGRSWDVPQLDYQHEQTTFGADGFESEGYIAVRGNQLWGMGGCYVGGVRYSAFDMTALRFSSDEQVPGYIKFSTPPKAGAKIYINVNFAIPFFGPFTSLEGRAISSFGDEKTNGKEDTQQA